METGENAPLVASPQQQQGKHSSEGQHYVGSPSEVPWHESRKQILIQFSIMSLGFGINHGTVVAVLNLASSEFGENQGGYSNGTLSGTYLVSSLFLACLVVYRMGAKYGLVLGTSVYCLYVGSFLVASESPNGSIQQWVATLTGAALGGLAAGIEWSSQGTYFAGCAKLYQAAVNLEPSIPDISLEDANSLFASMFSFYYLITHVLMALSSSWLLDYAGGRVVVYSSFTSAAVLAAMVCMFIRQLPPSVGKIGLEDQSTCEGVLRGITATLRLLATDVKCQLMIPTNLTFGLTSSFFALYVNSSIISKGVGIQYIGYISAIQVITGAFLSPVFALVSNKFGKTPVMLLGSCSFLLSILAVYFYDEEQLARWEMLVPLFMIYGIGAAVWECTNKGVFADFFPEDSAAAFSNIHVHNGTAGTIGYFLFPHLSKSVITLLCAGVTVAGMLGYLLATYIWRRTGAYSLIHDETIPFAALKDGESLGPSASNSYNSMVDTAVK